MTIISATCAWCVLIGICWYWNWEQIDDSITRIARAEAFASAGKDILYHKWSGMQGGVYIHPTKATPPSPYLSFLPEQTIHTIKGDELTLINPAYMVRQVNELSGKKSHSTSRLTSLHPLRPENSPDPWETSALKELQKHRTNGIYARQRVDGHDSLRIMRPMYVMKSCLKCHSKAGHPVQLNDLRGGISVSVDFLPYAQSISRERTRTDIAFVLLWLAGLSGLWLWYRKNEQVISELQTRDRQMHTLLAAAPGLICLKDKDGRWLEANKTVVDLFSLHDVNYHGKTDREIATIADSRFREAFCLCAETDEQTWKAGKNQRIEEHFTTLDGRKKVYDIIKAPLFNQDGSRQGLVVLGRDITELKKNEEQRQILISAIEQTAEAVAITDARGKVLYVNPACEKNSGYSKEELIGGNPRVFKSGEHDAAYYEELWKTIKAGRAWSGTIINRKKNGELFTEEMTISPVRNTDGEIVNFVAVKQDITEKIALEKEKASIEEQFYQAQKMESVGRLAGGIAHDLNNLLTPMLGYSELLLDTQTTLNEKSRSTIEQILLAGRRARDVIHRLLGFSRNQPLELKEIQLNRVICDFEQLLRRTIREDIALDLILDPKCPAIMADTSRLEQIIMNLSVNAQDAMENGGLLVIETRVVNKETAPKTCHLTKALPDNSVIMVFSDTGCGMDKNICKAVFEPFFTTKPKHKGTGLGLSTVYGIVRQLQGEITVQSTPGIGTEFILCFPPLEGPESPARATTSLLQQNTGQLRDATMLVVEDDEYVRSLLVNVLESKGFEVLSAENGPHALSLFEQASDRIDLLISDVVMPKMNGLELYELLVARQPSLQVIFLSGYTEGIMFDDDLFRDSAQFLQKPFAIADLFAIIDNILDQPSN